MENFVIPFWIAIVAAFALTGILILGVFGVVSFFRAWERGEPEFSASMPTQAPDRSPLHNLEARMARGEVSERELREIRDELDEMIRQKESDRRGLGGR